MREAVRKQLRKKFDVIIMAAAVSDYAPQVQSETKMDSSETVTVVLRRTPKIIDAVRESQKDALVVGFKAEADVTRDALVESARRKIKESGADLVIANDVGKRYKKNTSVNEVLAVDSETVASSGRKRKEDIAKFIRREIECRMG